MKILFEIQLNFKDLQRSNLSWLNNKNNWLFVIEDGKRMRLLSIDSSPAKEIHSTTLTETRICTSWSWNKDGTLLAMIIDSHQIYFWDIKTNNFTHYKTVSKLSSKSVLADKKQKDLREITCVEWSKFSNKLIICYSTGQLLICHCGKKIVEQLINSLNGVLTQVLWIETSVHADVFVCGTSSMELSVMTFNGHTLFYLRHHEVSITRAKLSPITSKQVVTQDHKDYQFFTPQNPLVCESLFLTYEFGANCLSLKWIPLQDSIRPETGYIDCADKNCGQLIDFHWLSQAHLIVCYSSGFIVLKHIKMVYISSGEEVCSFSNLYVLDLNREEKLSSGLESKQEFKSFKLMYYDKSQLNTTSNKTYQHQSSSYSIAALSDYKLFYYEIVEVDHLIKYAFEKVDDLDLTGSLRKLKLQLEQVQWCFDCSMLGVKLSNGHVLIYRTRLLDYKVALYGSRAAYLSDTNEITILNYKPQLSQIDNQGYTGQPTESINQEKAESKEEVPTTANNALIINVELRPSIIAIGPKHLAIALNNRIQFYLVSLFSKEQSLERESDKRLLSNEQEYVSIIEGISLNSRFVAVLFGDGRLKLHAIQSNKPPRDGTDLNLTDSSNPVFTARYSTSQDLYDSDERFFPDPTEPEQISTFILTEDLLLYCTHQCNINVFSLKDWTIVQTCQHSNYFVGPILKLKANELGNKFVCLLAPSSSDNDNVFLYDLYTNQIVRFTENDLFSRIFASQLIIHLLRGEPQLKLNRLITPSSASAATKSTSNNSTLSATTRPVLRRVMDAIWDGNGKTVLLAEQKCIHIFITLDHTLAREGPLIWYVKTTNKASSYTLLYASQGIVSFQTALGRVINSILESHNDEPRLTKMLRQIVELKKRLAIKVAGEKEKVGGEKGGEEKVEASSSTGSKVNTNSGELSLEEAQAEVMVLKLEYLRSILPIYSLTKCKEICENLMTDEVFNVLTFKEERCLEIDLVIWKQLAAWSLFTMNLNFALLIYRKHGLMLCARVLREIIQDAQTKRLDAKGAVKTRLLVLLGCDI